MGCINRAGGGEAGGGGGGGVGGGDAVRKHAARFNIGFKM